MSQMQVCASCKKEFERRRAPNKYCALCGEKVRGEPDYVRQRWHRLREMAVRDAGSMADFRKTREAQARVACAKPKENEIDSSLARLEQRVKNPVSYEVRSAIRKDAGLLIHSIPANENILLARANELLVDVGWEADESSDTVQLYAWDAVDSYRQTPLNRRDNTFPVRVACSVLRLSNVYRNSGNLKLADAAAALAYFLLMEVPEETKKTGTYIRLFRQVCERTARLHADYMEQVGSYPDRKYKVLKKLITKITDHTDSKNVPEMLDTARAKAGYDIIMGYKGDARKQLDEIGSLQQQMGGSFYDAPGALRPHIEFCLKEYGLPEAKKHIEHYVDLCRQNRHEYYHNVLRRWCEHYDLGFSFDALCLKTEYNSPIILFLPRGDDYLP